MGRRQKKIFTEKKGKKNFLPHRQTRRIFVVELSFLFYQLFFFLFSLPLIIFFFTFKNLGHISLLLSASLPFSFFYVFYYLFTLILFHLLSFSLSFSPSFSLSLSLSLRLFIVFVLKVIDF